MCRVEAVVFSLDEKHTITKWLNVTQFNHPVCCHLFQQEQSVQFSALLLIILQCFYQCPSLTPLLSWFPSLDKQLGSFLTSSLIQNM